MAAVVASSSISSDKRFVVPLVCWCQRFMVLQVCDADNLPYVSKNGVNSQMVSVITINTQHEETYEETRTSDLDAAIRVTTAMGRAHAAHAFTQTDS